MELVHVCMDSAREYMQDAPRKSTHATQYAMCSILLATRDYNYTALLTACCCNCSPESYDGDNFLRLTIIEVVQWAFGDTDMSKRLLGNITTSVPPSDHMSAQELATVRRV